MFIQEQSVLAVTSGSVISDREACVMAEDSHLITCAERRIMHDARSRRFLLNTAQLPVLNISRSEFTKQANSYQTRLRPLTLCATLAAFTKHCVAQVAYKRTRCHFLTLSVCLSVCLCVVLTPDRQHVRYSNTRRHFTSAEYQRAAHLASRPHRTPVINVISTLNRETFIE